MEAKGVIKKYTQPKATSDFREESLSDSSVYIYINPRIKGIRVIS